MRATRDGSHALSDLIETILEKGVVLSADMVIVVAGVPLIGITLHSLIASMETMLRFGVMEELDANRG